MPEATIEKELINLINGIMVGNDNNQQSTKLHPSL